jgi:hypothetical protein
MTMPEPVMLPHDAMRELGKRLAARELAIQQLRSALLKAIGSCFDRQAYERHMADPSYFTNQALSLQPTTPYLDAYVAERTKEKDAEFLAYKRATDLAYKGSEQESKDKLAAQSDALKLAKNAFLAYPIRGEHFMENLVATELATKALAAISALEK